MVRSIGDWMITHFFMWDKFDTKKNLKISRKVVSGNDDRAIFFFPYWTGHSSTYTSLANQFPDSTHIFFDYPNEVMSEDVRVSLNYIREILDDAVKLIKDLRKKGIKEIVLIGSSFGSNIAFKLSTMIKVEKVVLNMLDRDLARAIFKSPALAILRKKLEHRGFTFTKLKKVYSFLSVDKHLKNVKGKDTKFLFIVSNTDIFTPTKRFGPTFKKMDRLGIDYRVKKHVFLGHIASIYWNIIFSNRIRDFIED